MKNPILSPLIVAAAILGGSASVASAQVLFGDNFNTDSSSSWTINYGPIANASLQSAQFAFDYAYLGIPAAPGSTDTLGLRLRPNISGGAASPNNSRSPGALSGLSVSPTGQDFGTSYVLSFYAWANYFGVNGNLGDNVNSQGGTANLLFAVGTAGTTPLVSGSPNLIAPNDGVAFATTGDGGSPYDYRAFINSTTGITNGTGLVAGGSGNTLSYYAENFPSVTAPEEQALLASSWYPAGGDPMAGSSQAGSFGFAWHHVEIVKDDDFISWSIDGVPIFSTNNVADSGTDNIAIGTSDVNTTTARYPDLMFLLVENLQVAAVPEPSTIALGLIGGAAVLGMALRRRK